MTHIIILDDQKSQLEEIEKQILHLDLKDITIQKYQTPDSLIRNIDKINEYSIFLVDIVLEQYNGIDIANVINEHVRGAIIIFISNYLDRVADIYDAHHYYFIYKPDLEKRLPIALNKAMISLQEMKKTLILELKGKTVILAFNDIYYLERVKHTTFIKYEDEKIPCSYKLNDLISQLPSYFIRCHRSYIVNMESIIEIKRDALVLGDHTTIPISRAYQKEVHQRFQDFLISHI